MEVAKRDFRRKTLKEQRQKEDQHAGDFASVADVRSK